MYKKCITYYTIKNPYNTQLLKHETKTETAYNRDDLIIQSEVEEAPAPWENTTTGDFFFELPFTSASFSSFWTVRLRFEALRVDISTDAGGYNAGGIRFDLPEK